MATHRLPREVIAQRKGAVVPRHQTRHRAHSPEVEIHHRAVATENSSYLSQKKGAASSRCSPLCRFRVRQPRPPAAMYTKLKPKKPKNDLFIFAGLHSLLGFANPEMRV